jgi:transcriptional/translational regulatory protein YebC/TACO1
LALYHETQSKKITNYLFQQKDKANRLVELVEKLEELDDIRPIVAHMVR